MDTKYFDDPLLNQFYSMALNDFIAERYESASIAIKQAIEITSNAPVRILHAQILAAKNCLDEAASIITETLFNEPSIPAFNIFEDVFIRLNKEDEMNVLINDISSKYPLMGFNLRPHSLYRVAENEHGDIPPILFCSLPKSGSVYLSSRISEILKIPIVRITSHGSTPQLIDAWADLFIKGNCIAQEHLGPPITGLDKKDVKKAFVHLRDPRSAVISMLHHIDKSQKDNPFIRHLTLEDMGQRHFEKEFSSRIDDILKTYFVSYVQWIDEWTNFALQSTANLDVLLTTYDELLNDEDSLIQRILEFYNIQSPNQSNQTNSMSKAHHRKGLKEEWKEVFTPKQRDYAWEKMKHIGERYGWSQ